MSWEVKVEVEVKQVTADLKVFIFLLHAASLISIIFMSRISYSNFNALLNLNLFLPPQPYLLPFCFYFIKLFRF